MDTLSRRQLWNIYKDNISAEERIKYCDATKNKLLESLKDVNIADLPEPDKNVRDKKEATERIFNKSTKRWISRNGPTHRKLVAAGEKDLPPVIF